jgi:hypothetical protein
MRASKVLRVPVDRPSQRACHAAAERLSLVLGDVELANLAFDEGRVAHSDFLKLQAIVLLRFIQF